MPKYLPQALAVAKKPPVNRKMIAILAFMLLLQLRTDVDTECGTSVWCGRRGLKMVAVVYKYIKERYPSPPDDRKLWRSAISAMIKSVEDPYSEYLTPDIAKFNNDLLEDKIEAGIGVWLKSEKGIGARILGVLPESPAAKAGLKQGDVIVEADGKSLLDLDVSQVGGILRGALGTHVEITVRDHTGADQRYDIARNFLPGLSNVNGNIIDKKKGIGYARIFFFVKGVSRKFKDEVDSLLRQGLKGLIIDLRGNPGGMLTEGLRMSDLFLRNKVITIITSRSGAQSETVDQRVARRAGPSSLPDFPVVILVDRMTASAAELFSGALQGNNRAILIGEKTFGKGRIQEVMELGNTKSAIKLTVAKYLTPDGRDIDKKGLAPNITKKIDEMKRKELTALWQKQWLGLKPAQNEVNDPQLEVAVQTLEELLSGKK